MSSKRIPDFIVIGAMKCGTTTLAAQLGAQDGVFVTTPKEPNFFSDDDVFAQGLDWYNALFDAAGPNDIKGEASTHYTKRPDVPNTLPRMTATVPNAKLIYMIRNPMARLVSHYIHMWSLAETNQPLPAALDTHSNLVDYGRFGWQLQPFVETYGRDAIALTSLERLKAEPQAELNRLAKHIGHEGLVNWVDDEGQRNVSSERVRRIPLQGLLLDNPLATWARRTLVPKKVRDAVRSTRTMNTRPDIPQAQQEELQNRFLEDRKLLLDLFPSDPSLDLAYPFAK